MKRKRLRERLNRSHWAIRANVHRQLTRPVSSSAATRLQRFGLTAVRTAKPLLLGAGYWVGLQQAKVSLRLGRRKNIPGPVVTVLGSCRQDSVARAFSTTPIRDCVTYPHYSKEVLLELKFLKEDLDLPIPLQSVFRSSLLGDRLPGLALRSSWFDSTDLFVVEIASRKAYEVCEIPVHHVLHDATPEGMEDLGRQCVARRQDDSEIENDVLRIREILHPRPFMIVSHFCTRSTGERAELRDLLRRICETFNVPFFDPSRLLEDHEVAALVEDEEPITHFTSFGHQVLETEYRSLLSSLWDESLEPELCQVYEVSRARNEQFGVQGFGDFLMGSLHVMRMARLLGVRGTVSHSQSPLADFLADRRYVSPAESSSVSYTFKSGNPGDFGTARFVFSNAIPEIDVTDEDRRRVVFFCLQPLPNLVRAVREAKQSLGLGQDPYASVHVRLGDPQMMGGQAPDDETLVRLSEMFRGVAARRDQKTVVVSDSYRVVELAHEAGLPSRAGPRGHLGHFETQGMAVLESLVDFFLLMDSSSILQASVYGWGSTFSSSASILGGVPLESVRV